MSANAPQSVISWTPAGGSNSLNQTVQYKATDSSTWITFNTVSSSIATITITGLVNNTIYDFQVIDNCSVGGPVPSTVIHAIQFACVTLALTPTYNSVAAGFTLNGIVDITKVDVVLLANDNTTILATQIITSPANTSYTNTFTGLNNSTNYNVRLNFYAGSTFAYSNSCPSTAVTTSSAPVCAAPTNVTAVLS